MDDYFWTLIASVVDVFLRQNLRVYFFVMGAVFAVIFGWLLMHQ